LKKSNVKEVLEKHIVPIQEDPVRLSDYVPGIFVAISTKKGMKKAIERGLVLVNGVPSHTSKYINGGELIELCQSDFLSKKPTIKIKLDVLLEDDYLAIVHKPAGIVVSGNKKHTLENALPAALATSKEQDALPRPLPAHRLDYPTSGVLLIGKTAKAVTALNKLFENRTISKSYNAITIGEMEKSGTIKTAIKTKKAHTDFEVIKSFPSKKYGQLNLVQLTPHTGRKHQLRLHMKELGNPILGDQMYGVKGSILLGKGLYLHATSLSFEHPFTQEKIHVETALPPKFMRVINNPGHSGGQEQEE